MLTGYYLSCFTSNKNIILSYVLHLYWRHCPSKKLRDILNNIRGKFHDLPKIGSPG